MDVLLYLALLMLVSLPFVGFAALVRSPLVIGVPLVFWGLVVVMQNQGLLPGPTMFLGTAAFAALIGVGFAAVGHELRQGREASAQPHESGGLSQLETR